MRVSLIGSGNVAFILGRLLKANGIDILQVTGRNKALVKELADEVNAAVNYQVEAINPDADLYIICVSDSSIQSVVKSFPVKNKVVVHTSGSVSMTVLKEASLKYGVLYPLQSLKKEMDHFPDIPFLINGSSIEVTNNLLDFARGIAKKVEFADDVTREKLHTAAVIVSNFTNHLYALTHNFCQQEKVDFNSLVPLIKEVASRTAFYLPAEMQTGPAIRNDQVIIQRHLEMLSPYPQIKEIYSLLTESILVSQKNL